MSELRSSRSGPTKIQQFGATDENIAVRNKSLISSYTLFSDL